MLSVLAILGLLLSVAALPTFDDFGSTIHVSAKRNNLIILHDVTLIDPDSPGHLTLIPDAPRPTTFHIYRNRLWVYRNETAIWPVNFVLATQIPENPLQMVVGTKPEGVDQGTWWWSHTKLHYDHGPGWHSFYVCPTPKGYKGIFLFTTPSASSECDTITFSQHVDN